MSPKEPGAVIGHCGVTRRPLHRAAHRDARIEPFDRDTRAPRKVLDSIAEFAANAGIVLGGRPVKRDDNDFDLRWVGAMLFKSGVIEETGLAVSVLKYPATGHRRGRR